MRLGWPRLAINSSFVIPFAATPAKIAKRISSVVSGCDSRYALFRPATAWPALVKSKWTFLGSNSSQAPEAISTTPPMIPPSKMLPQNQPCTLFLSCICWGSQPGYSATDVCALFSGSIIKSPRNYRCHCILFLPVGKENTEGL